MRFVPCLHWKLLNAIALAELHSCGSEGDQTLKQAEGPKAAEGRAEFPDNVRSSLRAQSGGSSG